MSEYLCASCNRNYVKENTYVCLIDNLRAALRILLNFGYLDLTINPNTAHYGLRFYTEFNRLDAAGGIIPQLKCENLISLNANISVPAGYTPPVDFTGRDTVIPICSLRAVAAVVQPGRDDEFLNLLRRSYQGLAIPNIPCSCNIAILEALINYRCDAFSNNNIYEIGVSAIDRSSNPIRGKIVAYDSQLMWIQAAADANIPPTFYIVPLTYISFIIK